MQHGIETMDVKKTTDLTYTITLNAEEFNVMRWAIESRMYWAAEYEDYRIRILSDMDDAMASGA